MKKKIFIIFVVFILFIPQTVFANMGPPKPSSIGFPVTFEKSEDISVLYEIIDIEVTGDMAKITATYTMENTKDFSVTTQSMFIATNVAADSFSVTIDGENTSFTTKFYNLDDYVLESSEWRLNELEHVFDTMSDVDTITFDIDFSKHEQKEIQVSYDYELGGYPNGSYSGKHGEIFYFLTPASMWKDFKGITINLYLDDELPSIDASSLDFSEISDKHFQFKSDTLPEENLSISLGQSTINKIGAMILNPILWLIIIIVSQFFIIGQVILAIPTIIIWVIAYFIRNNKK